MQTITYTLTATLNISAAVTVQSEKDAARTELKAILEKNLLAQNVSIGDSTIRVTSAVQD